MCFLGSLFESRVRLDEDVGDDDVGAGASKREAVGSPESARSPGDNGDLPGQIEHATLLKRLPMRSESLALAPSRGGRAAALRTVSASGRDAHGRNVCDDLRTSPSRGPLTEDVATDHQALDLGCSFPDLIDLGVAHEALDRVFLDVSVSAEDLDRVDGHAHGHVAGE